MLAQAADAVTKGWIAVALVVTCVTACQRLTEAPRRPYKGEGQPYDWSPSRVIASPLEVALLIGELESGRPATQQRLVVREGAVAEILPRLQLVVDGTHVSALTFQSVDFTAMEYAAGDEILALNQVWFEDCQFDIRSAEALSKMIGRVSRLSISGHRVSNTPGIVVALTKHAKGRLRNIGLGVYVDSDELAAVLDDAPVQVLLLNFEGLSESHFEAISKHPVLARIDTAACRGVKQSFFKDFENRTGIAVRFDEYPQCP